MHAASEFEIWRMSNGSASERVWAASTSEGPSLDQVTLADGTLEGSAAVDGALAPWKNHGIRVRYNDGSEGDCGWSEWSPYTDFRTDDGSGYLFDQTVVRDIHLEIPPESWEPIHAESTPPGCVPWNREYYTGSVTYEDQVFEGVGLRAKGGCGSSRGLTGKAAFRINLNWDDPSVPGCPETRRLYGQKHLTLNNMVQDGSFMHERLTYRLYQAAGVAVPRCGSHPRAREQRALGPVHARRDPKRRFVDRRFESKNGMMYEGTYWCDLVPENVPPGEEDDYCLERKFSPSRCDGPLDPDADPKDYEVLRDLVETIDGYPKGGYYPDITNVFNFESYLSAWATEGVVVHWDNYSFDIMNNYRVYHDPSTDLWDLLPHGVDQTFGGDLDPWNVSGVLAERCLAYPECEAAFVARLNEVNDLFESMDYVAEIDLIHDLIGEHVIADPRKEYTDFQYDSWRENAREWAVQRPDRMRQIMTDHGF